MKGMSTFQTVLLGIFIAIVVVAIASFALFQSSTSQDIGKVTIWGTLPAQSFNSAIIEANKELPQKVNVTYVEKSEKDFDGDLIEALASGEGPDIVLIPQDFMARQEDKFLVIPGTSYPLRQFKDTFVEEASLYISGDGVLGVPLTVDPLVMYWNKDILFNENIPNPPTTWTDMTTLAGKLTKKDVVANITRATVPFGEFSNALHAKEVLATLFMQAGNPIVSRQDNGVLRAVLSEDFGFSTPPAVTALSYYTSYSNPSKPNYSWNRALQNSRTMFLAGDLAFYFGFASEFNSLYEKNPNLNYDVTNMPQMKDAKTRVVYGKMYGFSILKASKNIGSAFSTVIALTGDTFVKTWLSKGDVAPARRSLLAETPADPVLSVAYNNALIARGWLDPNTYDTSSIFKTMVEDVTSGRVTSDKAVFDASSKIQSLFRVK